MRYAMTEQNLIDYEIESCVWLRIPLLRRWLIKRIIKKVRRKLRRFNDFKADEKALLAVLGSCTGFDKCGCADTDDNH